MSAGSLSLAKFVMMLSAPAISTEDARYAFQDQSFIQRYPVQSRLQSVLGVRSFYVERNEPLFFARKSILRNSHKFPF